MNIYGTDDYFMRKAVILARTAYEKGEVPIGAVIVHDGRIIGQGYNQTEMLHDATAHAEMIAITQAEATIGDWRLDESVLYVTKEPCLMCLGAVMQTRITRIVFGAADPKINTMWAGIALLNRAQIEHSLVIHSGVLAEECADLLSQFFKERRG